MGNTNGMWKTGTWRSWRGIKYRTTEVDPRWSDFFAFYEDMGEQPKGTALLRRDRSKGYTPANCYWGTWSDKQNSSRWNVVLEFDGRSQTLAQWSIELNLNWRTLWNRLFRSPTWTVQDAFTTPARKRGGR